MTSRSIFPSAGFTLIELSIVLVIIGLVMGGLLAGKDMIRSADLRKVLIDEDRYKAAINTFRTKYVALPGDFTKATSLWGSAGGTGLGSDAACNSVDTTTTTNTCNGDGDGYINYSNNGYTRNAVWENFTSWKHLSNAGLIAGSFSNAHGPNGNAEAVPGVNVPATSVSGGGFTMMHEGTPTLVGSQFYTGSYGHVFFFGLKTSAWETGSSIVSSTEAMALDQKGDDGQPATGTIRSATTAMFNGNCTTANDTTAIYNISGSSGYDCSLIFTLGF